MKMSKPPVIINVEIAAMIVPDVINSKFTSASWCYIKMISNNKTNNIKIIHTLQ